MPSWQAKWFNQTVRAFVRRRNWGTGEALARRARLLFGAPRIYGALISTGVRCTPVREGPVAGEWILPGDAHKGVIFFVHGGGFVSCSPATHRPLTCALARLTRRRVFSVDYRLAPEHRYPAAVQDVDEAFRWMRNAGAPGEDVVIVGDSAGGNLVLSLAIRVRDEPLLPPAALVAFSPWFDLAGKGASARALDGLDSMFRYENLAAFAEAYLGREPLEGGDESPVYASLRELPPMQLHVGSTEILLDDSRRVHEAVVKTGGSSELLVFDDVAHGWQMLHPWLPEANASLRAAASFITRHL
jgi:acetyl esterase/lipase